MTLYSRSLIRSTVWRPLGFSPRRAAERSATSRRSSLSLACWKQRPKPGVDDHEPATLAVGEAEAAADVGGVVGSGLEDKVRGFGLILGGDDGLRHFGLLSLWEMENELKNGRCYPPRCFLYECESKGVARKGCCKVLKRQGGRNGVTGTEQGYGSAVKLWREGSREFPANDSMDCYPYK